MEPDGPTFSGALSGLLSGLGDLSDLFADDDEFTSKQLLVQPGPSPAPEPQPNPAALPPLHQPWQSENPLVVAHQLIEAELDALMQEARGGKTKLSKHHVSCGPQHSGFLCESLGPR